MLAHPSPCCHHSCHWEHSPPVTSEAFPRAQSAAVRHVRGSLQGRHIIQHRAQGSPWDRGSSLITSHPSSAERLVLLALESCCRIMVLLRATIPNTLLLPGQMALQGPDVPSQGQTLLSWSWIIISPQYSSSSQLPEAQKQRSQHFPWLQCSVSLQES